MFYFNVLCSTVKLFHFECQFFFVVTENWSCPVDANQIEFFVTRLPLLNYKYELELLGS